MQRQIIIIADDHPMVRAALREALRGCQPASSFHECADFAELQAALGELDGEADLLLIDLDMPGMQGFVGLLTVQAGWPTVPAVVVSATQDPTAVRRARECGASGFIPKSAPVDIIGEAVGSVLAGEPWFPPDDGRPEGDAASEVSRRMASLTVQQMRVLQMVVEGKLNKQIAGELNLAEQTVKGHVSAILKKLDVYSRTQAVLAVGPLLGKSPNRTTS